MNDLTQGSLARHLFATGGFMLFTMIFQTLYFLADLYWMGRLGKEAVAAVGVAGNLTFVVLALTQMLGVGTTTLVSHAAGQKDHERGLFVFNQSQVLSMLVGLGTLIAGLALRTRYTAAVGADAGTATMANEYLLWYIPAMALQFVMVAMGSALRGLGQFKPGMIVSTSTVVLNMVMAPFLMFGWGTGRPMGVAGAAVATFISIVIGVLWLTTYFVQKDAFLTFTPRDWAPNFTIWKKLLGIGLPSGVEFALMALYMVVVYSIIKPFGAEAQAGFGIGGRVIQAGFMPIVALGFSVAPVAGQNVGARLGARVRETYRSAVLLAVLVMAVFALLSHVAPAALIGTFTSDPRVVDVGTDYLKIISWTYALSGVNFVNSSMFQALGNTLPSLATSAVRMLIAIVPAILLSQQPGFEIRWIWYLSALSIVVQLGLGLWLLRRELHKKLGPAMTI